MFNYLAHAGENHETTTEAVAHVGQDPVVLWLVLLLVPVVIAFIAHNIFKLKVLNTMLIVSLFLIAFSVYSYQDPGFHTVVALAGGFGVVFVTAIMRLVSE